MAAEANVLPLVSCVMPTFNRAHWVPTAIALYRRQTYPSTELIVVDDSNDDGATREVVPHDDPDIRYIGIPNRITIGEKRNRGVAEARGSVIALWDDDDWYGPERLAVQVAPLVAGKSDITAFGACTFLWLRERQFWRISPELMPRLFLLSIVAGTQVFMKSVFEHTQFPEKNIIEEAYFAWDAVRRGARLERLPDEGHFIYIRHGEGHAWWNLEVGLLDRNGWFEVEPPRELTDDWGIGDVLLRTGAPPVSA